MNRVYCWTKPTTATTKSIEAEEKNSLVHCNYGDDALLRLPLAAAPTLLPLLLMLLLLLLLIFCRVTRLRCSVMTA
jgi:hypothetical protein